MSKRELIEKIRETATRIMEAAVANPAAYKFGDGKDFTDWLIIKRNNENCKWTLNFVCWCYCCKDWRLKELDNETLKGHLNSLEKTLADLTEYESSKAPLTVEMFLTDGDDLVSGEILEEIERYNASDEMVGYSVIKVKAAKLSDIVRVTSDDFVYRASAVENNFIKEWTQIGGPGNEILRR